ncbi:MAG TPA: hypothetical protein VLM37_03770 [Fibrobacteraceae bacterium]|nr:hypothetical protein [Fibrobacteraceae bacterium]
MFPFLAFGFAETHYRFHLPWSPLHEPWPEMLVDAPWCVEPGQTLPVWLVVRDADLFPVHVHGVEFRVEALGHVGEEQSAELEFVCDQPFHFLPLPLDLSGWTGPVQIYARIHASRVGERVPRRRASRDFEQWNYPGLRPHPLQVLILQKPLPKPAGWWAGETHCHTWHSSDPVEFGAPPLVLQQAAAAQGLDFLCCTDHSYDFAFRNDDYRIPADPLIRWQAFQTECAALEPYPLVIPGEEVSCGNAQGENVHLLVPGGSDFLPGLGDSGRQWFRNHPTLSLTEILERRGGAPCFAAHPLHPMSWIERKVFRRGVYGWADLHPLLAGLEFWNGSRDRGFRRGRAFWIRQLLAGRHLLPVGGNDAHGDLNRCTSVRIPLVMLRSSLAHRFGRVRTVVRGEGPLETQNLLHSFRRAQDDAALYCGDGPALTLKCEGNRFRLHAISSPDLGEFVEIRIFRGIFGQSREQVQSISPGTLEWDASLQGDGNYLRAECRTRNGHSAISAAFFH